MRRVHLKYILHCFLSMFILYNYKQQHNYRGDIGLHALGSFSRQKLARTQYSRLSIMKFMIVIYSADVKCYY